MSNCGHRAPRHDFGNYRSGSPLTTLPEVRRRHQTERMNARRESARRDKSRARRLTQARDVHQQLKAFLAANRGLQEDLTSTSARLHVAKVAATARSRSRTRIHTQLETANGAHMTIERDLAEVRRQHEPLERTSQSLKSQIPENAANIVVTKETLQDKQMKIGSLRGECAELLASIEAEQAKTRNSEGARQKIEVALEVSRAASIPLDNAQRSNSLDSRTRISLSQTRNSERNDSPSRGRGSKSPSRSADEVKGETGRGRSLRSRSLKSNTPFAKFSERDSTAGSELCLLLRIQYNRMSADFLTVRASDAVQIDPRGASPSFSRRRSQEGLDCNMQGASTSADGGGQVRQSSLASTDKQSRTQSPRLGARTGPIRDSPPESIRRRQVRQSPVRDRTSIPSNNAGRDGSLRSTSNANIQNRPPLNAARGASPNGTSRATPTAGQLLKKFARDIGDAFVGGSSSSSPSSKRKTT